MVIDKFDDGRGNLAEIEEIVKERILIARLMRPGFSISDIAASQDNKVVMLRRTGQAADTLYNYFDGDYDTVIQWLNEKGFNTTRRAQTRLPCEITYVEINVSTETPVVVGIAKDVIDPWSDVYRTCVTNLDIERRYEEIFSATKDGAIRKVISVARILGREQVISKQA